MCGAEATPALAVCNLGRGGREFCRQVHARVTKLEGNVTASDLPGGPYEPTRRKWTGIRDCGWICFSGLQRH